MISSIIQVLFKLKFNPIWVIAQSAAAVEYTDCTTAEV